MQGKGSLVTGMIVPGPLNALTDVAGIAVGHAEHSTRPTGTTVVLCAEPMIAAAEIGGGAPGTRAVSILDQGRVASHVDAIALSGGSAFGLDAAGGAMDRLRQARRGFAMGRARVPIVPGAIIFDLMTGMSADAPTDWDTPPWFRLGHEAADAALSALSAGAAPIAMGNAGAGMGARAGGIKGGLGTSSLVHEAGGRRVSVAALTVANPVGRVVVPGSRAFWAAPYERGEEFGGVPWPGLPLLPEDLDFPFEAFSVGTNTTLAVVATDLALDQSQCARVAAMARDGFARAIRPVHSPLDGDSIFVMATGRVPVRDPVADTGRAGMMAADCVARSIARGVHAAAALPGLPAWRDLGEDGLPGS
ncbi:MAG: P1 family peptidase [Pseudomonadota bacterium]